MDEAVATPPALRIGFTDQIHCVELSCYEWSQQLICIGLTEKIVVAILKFQDEDDTIDCSMYEPLRTFHHDTRPHSIAWSPETSLSAPRRVLAFCVAGADFKIRLYNSNLNDVNTYEILEGHKDYVNDVCYEPEGELLASVSDDHTCKLWAIKEDQKCVSTYHLATPGMSVRFHGEEPGKLLIAEKSGLILIYNVRGKQGVMSFDAGGIPLMSADWGLNPLRVAAIAGGVLLAWDISRPSKPLVWKTLYSEAGLVVRFSPAYEDLVATIGQPDNTLKVTNLKTKRSILCTKLELIGGISWHYKLPYICAGSDRDLCFWRVNN